ncbi:MAG: hypothetical protein Q7S66_01520 [bacterium]|nr:hypothetical protein [bacterium]
MKNIFKNISFHPKFAAVLDGIFSVVMIWWLTQISTWWMLGLWFLFRAALWGALVRIVFYPPEISRLRHWLSLLLFSIGNVLFLLFIEWLPTWYLLSLLAIVLPAVSFWLLPAVDSKLSFLPKPHRRWRLFLSAFGLAGIWSGVYASADFQVWFYSRSWWWLALTAVIATGVAAWWWHEYGIAMNKRFWLWFCVWFLLMLECSWIVSYLPLGFFARGMFLIWLWYSLWLLSRFELSGKGIDWPKHRWSAIINLGLMVVYLALVVRWK